MSAQRAGNFVHIIGFRSRACTIGAVLRRLASRPGGAVAAVVVLAGFAPALPSRPVGQAGGVPSVVLCQGWKNCTRHGYPSYGYQAHQSTAYWRMYPGNDCTNYVAYVEQSVYQVAAPSFLLGNAGQWPATAAKHGITVNQRPSVGAVAEWDGGTFGMGNYGHVGVVEQVGPHDSYIVVSQQGLFGTDGYQWTRINAGFRPNQWQEWPSNFVHFNIPRRALLGYFDSTSGQVTLRYSQTGGPANRSFRIHLSGAIPLTGHWGRNRTDRIGFYDPATGTFHLPPVTKAARAPIAFGPADMVPLVGDWQGTGTDGIGYYDPSTGTFYLRNTPTPGSSDESFSFGPPGMVPIVGNWTGGTADDVGYYDPKTGSFTLRNGTAANPVYRTFRFGPPGMVPLVGNWAGGRIDGIGYYDPASGRFHLRNTPTRGWANAIVRVASGITPLTGDWFSS